MSVTEQQTLKHTPLYHCHLKLGGKMVSFSGFELPVYYSGIIEEHQWVRSSCGVFDVSHLGEAKIEGAGAFDFLQRMIPGDLNKIGDSEIMYSVLLNEQGGILDDILVYRLNASAFYLVINAAHIQRKISHLRRFAERDVVIKDESMSCACVAVQGPRSPEICDEIIGGKPSSLRYYEFMPLPHWGPSVWISRTGYTGEDGFEIFSDPEAAVRVWDELMEKGKRMGLRPVGIGARNTLRLEAGNALYGADMDETRTPFEAGLGWLVSSSRGDFVGRKALSERKEAGFKRHLCGFKVEGRAVPREGHSIKKEGKVVGTVTSGSFSPTLKEGIGLGYVETALAEPGTPLDIEVHGRDVPAHVVKMPFVPLKHK